MKLKKLKTNLIKLLKNSWIKIKSLSLTNKLLILLLVLGFIGFYDSSPKFRNRLNKFESNILKVWFYYIKEKVGDASLTCIEGNIPQEEYNKLEKKKEEIRINECGGSYTCAGSKMNDLYNYYRVHPFTTVNKRVGVIREREYRFFIKVKEKYDYQEKINFDICSCSKKNKDGICEWQTNLNKPIRIY